MAINKEVLGELIRLAAEDVPSGRIAQQLGLEPKQVYSLKQQYKGLIIEEQTRQSGRRIDGTPAMPAKEVAPMETPTADHMTLPERVSSGAPKIAPKPMVAEAPASLLQPAVWMGGERRRYILASEGEKNDVTLRMVDGGYSICELDALIGELCELRGNLARGPVRPAESFEHTNGVGLIPHIRPSSVFVENALS